MIDMSSHKLEQEEKPGHRHQGEPSQFKCNRGRINRNRNVESYSRSYHVDISILHFLQSYHPDALSLVHLMWATLYRGHWHFMCKNVFMKSIIKKTGKDKGILLFNSYLYFLLRIVKEYRTRP